MSIKIRMFGTGEIREVTNNIAYDLIDRKKAELYRGERPYYNRAVSQQSAPVYQTRQMRAERRAFNKKIP